MLNNENGLHPTPITNRTNRFFAKKETKEKRIRVREKYLFVGEANKRCAA